MKRKRTRILNLKKFLSIQTGKKYYKRNAIILVTVLVLIFNNGIQRCFGFDASRMTYAIPYKQKAGTVQVHFIDIGQGDSILIKTGKSNILIDTGRNTYESQLKSYLDINKVRDIELAVFTHSDADHIGGADMVIENYNVHKVLMTESLKSTAMIRSVEEKIYEYGTELIIAEYGQHFYIDSLTVTVLAPLSVAEDSNNNSIVLRLDYGQTSFLFTGDAESEEENELLERLPHYLLDSDVLKVGHHGSDSSTGSEFLKAVTPKISVISCGDGNSYGHPGLVTLSRLENIGSDVYRTDEVGTVTIITDGIDYTVKYIE